MCYFDENFLRTKITQIYRTDRVTKQAALVKFMTQVMLECDSHPSKVNITKGDSKLKTDSQNIIN